MKKVLDIGSHANYLSGYTVTYAKDFTEAKALIAEAEAAGTPYAFLNIPKRELGLFRSVASDIQSGNDAQFYEFLDWLQRRRQRYAIAVEGLTRERSFCAIRDYCVDRGFNFLD